MVESLTAEMFFDGDSLHGSSRLTFDGPVVSAIEPHAGPCDHHLVTPGLVDVQMNGFADIECARAEPSDLARLDSMLASRGTTAWLATIVTAPLDRLDASISRIATAIEAGLVPGCVGIHVEGPFLGSAPGAHRRDWIIEPDLDWVSRLPECVRLVTVGIESTRSLDLIAALVDAGVTVSIGHSRPSADAFRAAVDAGASMVTHLYNGMSGVHHRDDGLALEALLDDRVAAGLIADLAHVSVPALRLAFRAKHGRGVVLVSDSVAWESEPAVARGVEVIDGAPRLRDGTLAGSSSTLAMCMANAVSVVGIDLPIVLRSATSAPAETVGAENQGRIREGTPCDILTFDKDLRLVPEGCRLVFPRGNKTHP